MSLIIGIRSAPIQWAKPELVDETGGDGATWTGPLPEFHGSFQGEWERTALIFTVATGGAIASAATVTVTWATTGDGPNLSGTLHLGTDHNYSADDVIPFTDGLSISFGSGTLTATQTCSVDIIPRRILPHDYQEIVTAMEATSIDLRGITMRTSDVLAELDDGRRRRSAIANQYDPTISALWLEKEQYRALQEMEQRRHRCTLFENYGRNTRFLWRGGGIQAMIGRTPTLRRANPGGAAYGVYRDPETGLYRNVGDGEPRFGGGPELESADETFANRHNIPPSTPGMGKAIVIDDSKVNVLDDAFHPEIALDGTETPHWQVTGGAVQSIVDDVPSVLDPGGNWPNEYMRGVLKVELGTGGNLSTATADRVTLTPGYYYSPSVWLRGRGYVTFKMRTGIAGPTDVYASADVDIPDDGRWHQVIPTSSVGAVPAGHVLGDLAIHRHASVDTDHDVFYVSAAMIEEGGSGIQSDTTQHILNSPEETFQDQFTLRDRLPPSGSLSFWYRHPIDWNEKILGLLIDDTGHFVLERDGTSGSEAWNWWTIDTDRANAMVVSDSPADLGWWTWVHIGMTWYPEIDVGPPLDLTAMRKKLYINGAKVGDIYAPAADRTTEAFGYVTFGPCGTSGPMTDWSAPYGMRFAEVRIDDAPMDDAEMLRQYDRIASGDHALLHRVLSGRIFDVEVEAESYLNAANRDKFAAAIQLREVDTHDSSLITGR